MDETAGDEDRHLSFTIPTGKPTDLTWAEQALYERARLAMLDPVGEAEAISPLSPTRARQILLELHDRQGATHGSHTSGYSSTHDERALLERLGADTSRRRGRVPCPAHGGRDRNLAWAISETGRVLLHCFSHQCRFEDIVAAVR